MSKKQQYILISPPMFLESNNQERIISQGHRCSNCSGNGWFIDDDLNGQYKTKCPVCKGTGKLNAEITIVWEPDL